MIPDSRSFTKLTFPLAALLFLPSIGWAIDDLSFDGYYKSFFVGYRVPGFGSALGADTPPMGSVSNRLRLNSHWRFSNRVQMAAAYDLVPTVQDHLLFVKPPVAVVVDPLNYRVADIDSRLYPAMGDEIASFAVLQNLDRAFFTVRTDRADVYIGRQAVAFGSARVVNPTDVIAPYSYGTLDIEDRVGVDAVRVRVPAGMMGEIDAGYVCGDDFEFEQSAMFLRTRLYVTRTDLSLLMIGFRGNMAAGLDLARSIGGAGCWLEAAYTFADALADEDAPGSEDYFRSSIGLDYSFGSNIYTFIEYHFNQAGRDDAEEYLSNIVRTAYVEGAVYLMGRHYLAPGMTCQLTPLLTGRIDMLWNLSDWSAYLAPGIEYNLAENIYLAGGAYVGVGKRPESILRMRSEFGSYPDLYFSSFRVYF